MFCPHCGQQQISGEVRFCSRCGFALGGVNELLARGGILPGQTTEASTRDRSARFEGVRRGVLMWLIGMVLVPALMLIIGPRGRVDTFPTLLIPLAAVICFVGGFVRLLYALLFQEGTPRERKGSTEPTFATAEQIAFRADASHAAQLPPLQSTPVADYLRPRVRTAEIVPPPSVTENATKLLENERGTGSSS